jgi:hypothetical protein
MASACIKYFIPDDGDDQNHPNVFFMPSNNLTVGDIRKVISNKYLAEPYCADFTMFEPL